MNIHKKLTVAELTCNINQDAPGKLSCILPFTLFLVYSLYIVTIIYNEYTRNSVFVVVMYIWNVVKPEKST